MKKKIAIYGAGGLGREMAGLLNDIASVGESWSTIGFFDDGKKKGEQVDGLPVLGGLNEINGIKDSLSLVVAISDPSTKERLVKSISNDKIDFPVLVHPSCLTGDKKNNHFGRGTILTAGVILTTHIVMGEFVLVNLATTVGHDVSIGDYCSIMPGASLSGAVSLGSRCVVGTGARILQNISLGTDNQVGAGAVVTKSFGSGLTLVGIPAAKSA